MILYLVKVLKALFFIVVQKSCLVLRNLAYALTRLLQVLKVFFSVLTRKQEVVWYLSFNLNSLKTGHLCDDFLVLVDLVQ